MRNNKVNLRYHNQVRLWNEYILMTVPVNGKTRPEPSLDVRTLAYIIGCLSSLRTSQTVVIDAWPELFPILTSASRRISARERTQDQPGEDKGSGTSFSPTKSDRFGKEC
jgi:hypothetical protein